MSDVRGLVVAREDGGVIVLTALLLPFVFLLLSLSVDVGNWWVHKRHLQLQADAAALAGGAMFGKCFTDASAANAAIQSEATKYNGAAGSVYNGQVGNANKGTITVLYQSKTYAAGSHAPDDTETQAPCDTASLMFDVKATEANLPLLFNIPGLDFVPSINAHARVQLKTVIQQDGMLPVAVPDLRFNYAFATFVNEATGAVLATSELVKTGTSGGQQLWSSLAGVDVPISASHIGVRIRLVGGTTPARRADSSTPSATTSPPGTASCTSAAGAARPRPRSGTPGSWPARAPPTRTSRRPTAPPACRPKSISARRIR